MPDAWQVTEGHGTTVAVIDSGVDISIPDLTHAVVPGTDHIAGGDGMEDHADDGHGTSMASLIASRGDTSGITGVAPSSTVMPIALHWDSSVWGDDAIAGLSDSIRYAVDNGAQVINTSLGARNLTGEAPCPEPVAAAIRYALANDVVLVAAAGNEAGDSDGFPDSCPGVLTVGAVTRYLEPWENSRRSEFVDVAAPGSEIVSLVPGGETVTSDGTSNATALVSGVVALVRARYPDDTAYQVVARVLATTVDLAEPGRDDATGYGMVQPYEALTADIPPDAPNPVFDAAGDLTDTDEPPDPADGPATAPAPDYSVPQAEQSGSPASTMVFLVVGGLLLLLLATSVLIVVLVLRSRRTGRPSER